MTKVPEYLNEEFFKEALEQTLPKPVQIKEFAIEKQARTGGYCSDIYRINVRYTSGQTAGDNAEVQEEKLLVKELFENLAENSREHMMYEKVLPGLHAILQAAGIQSQLAPKIYYTRKVRRETHVLEDMNAKGYKILDRVVGFNVPQTQAVLKKVAEFHAASMIYKEKHPDIVDNMKAFFCASEPSLMDFTQRQVDSNTKFVTKIVETWPGYEHIAAKMLQHNMGADFQRKFLPTLDKTDAKVRVILHGDVWIQNILIRDTPTGCDAVFVDYQNSCDCTPAIDVINVFNTSGQLEVLQHHRPQLIEYYHSVLANTLNQLQYPEEKIPTLADILAEIHRVAYFSYYVLIFPFAQTNLSHKLADGLNFNSFSDPKRLEANRQDIYSNPRVLETYKLELKRLDALGILD